MRIRKKLLLNIYLPLAIAATVAVLVLITMNQEQKSAHQETLLLSLFRNCLELNHRTNYYLLYKEKRTEREWYTVYDSILANLSEVSLRDSEDTWRLERIRENLNEGSELFSEIVKLKAGAAGASSSPTNELADRLSAQLLIRIRTISGFATQWYNSVNSAGNSNNIRNHGLILSLILGSALVTAATLVPINRKMEKSVSKLIQGTKMIGSGNLDHRIGLHTDDEFSEVSSALEQMAGNLNRISVSRDELAREVTARQLAEQSLQEANETLERKVRDRTSELEDTYKVIQEESEKRLSALEELREKEQMLLQQSRLAAMGEMIGNIAHQWRQPLNILGLLLQELPVSYQTGEFNQEYLKGKTDQGMQLICHMSRTIDDFRSFFSPDKGKSGFNVEEVVKKTLSLVEAGLKEQRIHVDLVAEENVRVEGFPNEFSQVIMNIMLNARDALKERKVPDPTISIRIFREEGSAIISIADNAGGIPADVMPRIFDPYFSTKGPEMGTGIGLFMSRNIIEKSMNGELRVRNLQQGAEFRIVLKESASLS